MKLARPHVTLCPRGEGDTQRSKDTQQDDGCEHATLVQLVKVMQRGSEVARLRWHDFCDIRGGGIRNPAKHSIALGAATLDLIINIFIIESS